MRDYHRRSVRLEGYDYTQNGYYFITVCIQNRECLLGKIVDGKVKMNDVGIMVNEIWNKLTQKYSQIRLAECIVMPNHLHAIIIKDTHVGAGLSRPKLTTINNAKGREDRAPTLGNIIAFFKYQTTKQYNQGGIINKFWQRNYYEHIIRNEREYFAIKRYIQNNPQNWEKDELFII